MNNNVNDNSRPTAVEQLAELLNELSDGGLGGPDWLDSEKGLPRAKEPVKGNCISELDIWYDLLLQHKDDPEMLQRLKRDFLARNGKSD